MHAPGFRTIAGRCRLLCLLTGWLGLSAEPARPNFLWLIAEDFGPDLGCYGTREVATPNLDRLAAEGMRYTRAYTTAPVCSASRSAFMTGMYQTTIGAHNHRSHRDDGYRLPDGVRVITGWLRDGGYRTGNIRQFPEPVGFRGTGKTDWNFTPPARPFDTDQWTALRHDGPFHAQVNFSETHREFRAPRHADPDRVELPPYYPDHPVARADWAAYLDAATELDRKVGRVLDQLEADGLAETTVVVFFGDHGQAHVRAKQFCYEEGLHVPLIIRWPSGIPRPDGYRPGAVEDRFVEAIDLAATTLALAGLPRPARMQGRVFLGSEADPPRTHVFGARDRCDETVFRLRTVRDDRHRYIRNYTPEQPFLATNAYKERQYPVWNLLKELHAAGRLTPAQEFLCRPSMPAEELYDLTEDPHEIRNLAESTDPVHRDALRRLRGLLDDWIRESDDQGRHPEPPEVVANRGATRPAGR